MGLTVNKILTAKPVWPSKKTFFGLYDPKPQFRYISEYIASDFKHTIHKSGNDIYFFQPDVTYIDEATNFTDKQWERLRTKFLLGFKDKLKNSMFEFRKAVDNQFLYGKETKVPTVSKRQRFLDAGGSFSKPEMYFTDRNNIAIMPCYNGPTCRARPVYEAGGSIHFHNSVQKEKNWFVKDRTHNFENILQNTNENIWHAARDRRFYIKQGQGFGYIGKETMADKHLISTMRYLVAAWEEIKKEAITKLSSMLSQRNSISGILQEKKNEINACENAPSFYLDILPCWATLTAEFVERFGSEALTSVLDGN